jgi:hypothetical protein
VTGESLEEYLLQEVMVNAPDVPNQPLAASVISP